MSYPDPHGKAEPRGWPPPETPVRHWDDSDDEPPRRARHAGVAPDPYAADSSFDSGERSWDEDPPTLVQLRVETGGPTGAGGPGEWSGRPEESSSAYAEAGGDHDVAEPYPGADPVIASMPDPAEEAAPARRGPGRRRASRSRPPTRASRAGRNLPAAIAVGLTLGALVVAPLFLYKPAFLAVIGVAVAVGIWEMARAIRTSGANPPLVPLVGGGLLMVGLAWWAGPDALSLGLLVTVLSALVWRLGDGPAGFQRDLTASALIAVYVPFLAGFAALLAEPADGDLRVLVTLVAVVLSDTGGYVAGVLYGKHPMAPTVSPKKSWEGFAGSVTATALGSALLLWLLLDVAPWWGAVFGLAVSGAAVLGDLGESMIKRDLGVKDMSNLLPGHGGLMDRLDSVLFAVPTAYLLLAIFAPAG
ncbi:phosphatidate cytidylyltransferase [Micromonospora polyrhachis]|uniref:Phosphatidate cytidylyltransferase n=1 Tax=Micromonospora polyrhachis TaxID=1282883 RepID=A0A7W7SMQ7_9ACTN|nr:phosphatidate cytidylyltransferase [Micromonospora polyrhachis]MBB4957471.1 phosphatidate cytidylyltransferase [Micromonospora polyrhachis]